MAKRKGSPAIEGLLEVSKRRSGVFIGSDPAALRSLARLLTWLADVNQETLPNMPDGERCHVHLHAGKPAPWNSLTPISAETELCRLDAKGTGDLPERYRDGKNLTESYRKAKAKRRKTK
jgi:hypothetical protein